MGLDFLAVADQRRLLDEGAVSPVDLVEAALARIEEVQPRLNCFVHVWADEARRRARELPVGHGPLHGVPVAIKDTTPWAGHPITLGSRTQRDVVADRSAWVVERLLDAGAVIIGSTNTPEFAHASITDNRLWGATRNPWNLARTTGGSSGGAGAAVASGCVAVAEGSDMGGSVRIPAAWCGVVGLKPSLGRIPMDVLPGLWDSISHHGPLGRTVDDVRRFLDVTQGPSLRDPYSSLPAMSSTSVDVRGQRVALSTDLGCWSVDPQIVDVVERAARHLADAGLVIERTGPRFTPRDNALWLELWGIFMSAYYGDLTDTQAADMDTDVLALIDLGRSFSAVDGKRMEIERSGVWNRVAAVLETHDIIVCPTMSLPPGAATKSENQRQYFIDDDGRYHGEDMTSVWNLVSPCPVISVPGGRHMGEEHDGLPIGVQIVGRPGAEDLVLAVAQVIEDQVGAPAWRPDI
ncbi:MAG: amidase [Actinomycetota bacterium]